MKSKIRTSKNLKNNNMGKKIFTLAIALVICASVSAQTGWRIGATIGSFGNGSVYSGGNSTASALFTHQKFGTGMIGVLFRKQINNHLSFQTGLNFSSLGFQYSMASDYSLTNPKSHYMNNQVGTGLATIPATLIWNFNPNCKNVRWFVGAGLSLVNHGSSTSSSKTTEPSSSEAANLGITSGANMTQTVSSGPITVINAHWMFGIEKIYKRGTMLSLAAYFNRGFSQMATSNVSYIVNGQTYSHSFTNYNNFAGLTLSYYFKTLGGHKTASPTGIAK
jgi:hypothetical protein